MKNSALVSLSVFASVMAVGLIGSSSASASTVPGGEDEGEPFAPSEPQHICDPTAKPGVLKFRDYVLSHFGGFDDGITRACDVGGPSEHKEGRAWDWGIDASARVDDFLSTLFAKNAELFRRAGLLYVIYNRRIWSSSTRAWVPYNGANPHTDHVHFSFSWAGAKGLTSFYQTLNA